MMKKIQYIAPVISITNLSFEHMLALSDENLMTTEETFDKKSTIETKRDNYNVWNDDWSRQ